MHPAHKHAHAHLWWPSWGNFILFLAVRIASFYFSNLSFLLQPERQGLIVYTMINHSHIAYIPFSSSALLPNVLPLLCLCYSSNESVASPVVSSTIDCNECQMQQLDTHVTITFTLPQEVCVSMLACHGICVCVLCTDNLLSFQNLPRDSGYNDSLSCVYWEFAESVVAAREHSPLTSCTVLICLCRM